MAEAPEPPNARRTSPLPGRLNELSDPEQPVRHPERSRSATPTPPKRRPGRPRKNSLPLPAHHDSPSMSRTASALSQVQSIDNNPTLPTAGPSHQSQPDAWSSSDEQSSERDDLRGDKSYSARASRGAPARARGRGRGRGRGSKNTSATTPRSIDRTPSKTSDGLLSVPLPVTRSRSRSPSIEAHSRETSPRPAGVSAPPSLSSRRSRSPSAASAPAPLEGLQKGFPNPLKRRRSPKVSGLQSEQGQLDDASDGDSSDLSSAPGDFDRHRDPYAKKPRAATPDTDIPSPAVVGPAASFHSRGFSVKRKRLVTASSDSENSEASAAIPRASSLPLHSRGASKSAKRQSREQSRAEAESKRQRALATVLFEQSLLESDTHPYLAQLVQTIEAERLLRLTLAKKVLDQNVHEADTLCFANSRARLQQWRNDTRFHREGLIDACSRRQRGLHDEFYDPYLQAAPHSSPPPLYSMYINAPGSAQAWTDAMRELPLPLPATDIATDLAFMGYTVLSEDHAVLDRIDDLQHPPPPPPPPPQVSNAPGNQATVPAKSPVVQSASNTPLIAKGQEVKPTDVPSRPPHQAQQTHASALLDRGEQPGMNMNPKRPAPISVGETIHPLPQSSLSSPTQRQPPPISKLRPGDAPSEFNFARSPAGMQPPSAAADNRAQQPPMRHSLPEQPTSLKPGPDLPHSHSKQQRSAPVHPHYREYDLSGPPNWPREAFPQQQQRHPKDDHLGPHSQRPDDFTQPPSSDRIIFGANEPASLGGPRQQQQQSLPSMNLPGGPVKLPPIYTLSPGHQSAP